MKGGCKNGKHNPWLPSLESHVFLVIGRTPANAIDNATVLGTLEPIWLKIPDTARRILQGISTTFRLA